MQNGSRSSNAKVMLPIDSLWMISYSNSLDPIIVCITIIEIFDVQF